MRQADRHGSIIRLIGAVLLEANDEWQTQKRYMQIEGMVELMAPAWLDFARPCLKGRPTHANRNTASWRSNGCPSAPPGSKTAGWHGAIRLEATDTTS